VRLHFNRDIFDFGHKSIQSLDNCDEQQHDRQAMAGYSYTYL
jgi:hypothetical protein